MVSFDFQMHYVSRSITDSSASVLTDNLRANYEPQAAQYPSIPLRYYNPTHLERRLSSLGVGLRTGMI